jgi:hypothetical protein
MTNEFDHYPGCGNRDPDNCSGCALTSGGAEGPNYSGWPLVYIENKRTIPSKWAAAFIHELTSDNKAYSENIRKQIAKHGLRITGA